MCIVYLREVGPEVTPANFAALLAPGHAYNETVPSVVHIYEGRRELVAAPDIPKFAGVDDMWRTTVSKLREEKLFRRDEIFPMQY